MKTLLILFALVFTLQVYAQIPDGYYDDANGLSGSELRTSLYDIIKGHTTFSYTSISTDTWDILCESDRDPDNPDNVILLYTGKSVDAEQEYNSGHGWSREHVWAKSHGDFGTSRGAGTDAHHLRPADISVNSARNNRDFDDGGVPYFDNGGTEPTECFTDTYTWEPRAEVKGDVARMIFYMAIRYNGDDNEPDLSILGDINTISLCDNDNSIGYIGNLSTLLEWNALDPVDEFERNRNEVIYSYQKNRNPFIDIPDFVDQIWASGSSQLKETDTQIDLKVSTFACGFSLELGNDDYSTITLMDIMGRTQALDSGVGAFTFDQLTPGVYILLLKQSDIYLSRKILIPAQ